MGQLRYLLVSLLLPITLASADRTVLTESGPVRGKTVASGRVEAYLGIPYAEPPVGQLRFAKPVPKRSWSNVLDATKMPPPCIQMDSNVFFLSPDLSRMSEDCLYLNVWVPQSSKADVKPKAVMFFIHGGAFLSGSSDMKTYDGERLAEHGDVVLVTINYRVGVLGFFSGNTKNAPGNLAIHDQILALQWVKENARHFNGDPDKITIFGQSAGAFSVSLLQLSPSSRNLFKRAILQSGSAVNPLYTVGNKEAAKINLFYAQETGCASANSADVLKCMRKVTAKALAKADLAALTKGIFVLLPRFGEELFRKGAISSFKEGQFKNSEVMMGVTRDEGSFGIWFLFEILTGAKFDGKAELILNRTIAHMAIKQNTLTGTLLEMATPEESERIVQSYLNDADKDSLSASYLKAVSDALGDGLLTCGAVFQAEYQSARGDPVYFYMFDHQTTNSPFPKWTGVPHFEEVPYVFGNPLVGDFTEEEKGISRNIMDKWTTFAKTGNPNVRGSLQWPRFSAKDPKYLVIARKDHLETRPDNKRCDRWRSIFSGNNR